MVFGMKASLNVTSMLVADWLMICPKWTFTRMEQKMKTRNTVLRKKSRQYIEKEVCRCHVSWLESGGLFQRLVCLLIE